jgi:hypothetical protein
MNIPLISYISGIMSRLAYFDNDKYLDKYINITDIPELKKQFTEIKNIDIENIFELKTKNMISINKKVNNINYNEDLPKNISSDSIQYISICTSNYSGIYIVADKRMKTIFVCFRGTYSPKSALSYLQVKTFVPTQICEDTEDGYLLGVFKITAEVFYTIRESIRYLSKHFLKTKDFKLVATGHSLGGAMANVFSYLWVQKHKQLFKIICITFGSPRVMNSHLIKKFNKLIQDKIIMYTRYISNGDPLVKLPLTSKKFENSYYFPDDYDDSLDYVAITCNYMKKTKKVKCNLKNKTKKAKLSMINHGIYLGIIFKDAANGKMNFNKEIKRDIDNSTLCRIIIWNKKYKAVFFKLNDVKYNNSKKKNLFISKIIKNFILDYTHQDIYMNSQVFENLIKNSIELDNTDLNPLEANKIEGIQYSGKVEEQLYCL